MIEDFCGESHTENPEWNGIYLSVDGRYQLVRYQWKGTKIRCYFCFLINLVFLGVML